MTKFHAVMIDETGCEFGATVAARSRADAYEYLKVDYPESRCVQLESPADTRKREARLYQNAKRMYDEDRDY